MLGNMNEKCNYRRIIMARYDYDLGIIGGGAAGLCIDQTLRISVNPKLRKHRSEIGLKTLVQFWIDV
jgi:hypothetical protein